MTPRARRWLVALAGALLAGLLLGVLSGINAGLRLDVGDQSWVAKLYSLAIPVLFLALPWMLDNARR